MLGFNFLILAFVTGLGVEATKLGDVIETLKVRLIFDAIPFSRHRSLKEPPSPFAPTTKFSAPLPPQCAFTPHPTSLSQSEVDTSIPIHAWPYISILLTYNTVNLLPPSPQDPFHRSRVHTLRLKDLTKDVSLEGIVVGLVYTAPQSGAHGLELRDVKKRGRNRRRSGKDGERFKYRGPEGDERGKRDRECLAEAIKNVERDMIMEGVLELSGEATGGKGGRVGFLVYRVD